LQSNEKANNVLLNHYRAGRVENAVGIVTRLGGPGFYSRKGQDILIFPTTSWPGLASYRLLFIAYLGFCRRG